MSQAIVDRKPSHRHLKAGWKYDDFTGSKGGWELGKWTDAYVRVVCRDEGVWYGMIVRTSDGKTMFSTNYPTRDAAMLALESRAL
jgi:hypothetical protein